ncbi:MAG: diphthine synthase [Candidatus Hadarchaeota archaeon]|nr:diphthine synthase [Candidatus Hadarchaeota archaeon]
MLIFIGLGLQGKGLSLRGLEGAQSADVIYAELYTSLVPGLDLSELERRLGNSIKVLDRETVEQRPGEILERAKTQKVAFLVPGDPMVATTHVDLRLRAAKRGIETRVIHGASIASAALGLAGLQSYKFGRSATIPFPDNPSETPYRVLAENLERGLHTLLLLDIRADERRALSANDAIKILLDLESRLKKEVFTPQTLAVVVARAGSPDPKVKADHVKRLQKLDFGYPPHVLIVPGKLHFLEAEALRVFASAPAEVVEKHAQG